ncbi:MAG: HepT-like ribonuclease domain-containing protein [Minisyncoccia bacterium]
MITELVKNRIEKKLEMIFSRLPILKDRIENDNQTIKDNIEMSAVIERYFQIVVDSAISINEQIISSLGLETPDDYPGTFFIIAKSGVIPIPFSQKISGSVGLRNLVVHAYEEVKQDQMINDIRNNIYQYDEYVAYIKKFLDSK